MDQRSCLFSYYYLWASGAQFHAHFLRGQGTYINSQKALSEHTCSPLNLLHVERQQDRLFNFKIFSQLTSDFHSVGKNIHFICLALFLSSGAEPPLLGFFCLFSFRCVIRKGGTILYSLASLGTTIGQRLVPDSSWFQ